MAKTDVELPLLLRILALALAIWSHGAKSGKESDDCYPGRAKRFLRWLEKGE